LFRPGTPLLGPHPLSLGTRPEARLGRVFGGSLLTRRLGRGARPSHFVSSLRIFSLGSARPRLVGLGRLDLGCSLLVGHHVTPVSRASRLTGLAQRDRRAYRRRGRASPYPSQADLQAPPALRPRWPRRSGQRSARRPRGGRRPSLRWRRTARPLAGSRPRPSAWAHRAWSGGPPGPSAGSAAPGRAAT